VADGFWFNSWSCNIEIVKLSGSSCGKWTWKDEKDVRQHSVSRHENGPFRSILTRRPSWSAKIESYKAKRHYLRQHDMDIEILKVAMLASKSTMLKGDHVTTEDDSF